jgi:hypothetical protein
MDPDLVSGGVGALAAWVIVWVTRRIGSYAERQKWTHTIITEDVARVAEERDQARAELAVARAELAAAKSVAEACQAHMTRQLKGIGRRAVGPAVERDE